MKALFLDHDGVISLPGNWGSNKTNKLDFDDFSATAVLVLNELIKTVPDLEIIISSDWRLLDDLVGLGYHYKIMGVQKCPYDVTPDSSLKPNCFEKSREYVRAEEIKLYLNLNASVIEKWVAIDDLDMSLYLDNFVHVDKDAGITEKGVYERLVKFLNN
jgi:hypothetical protein